MARLTSFDGVSLHYDDQGDGPPVLLLHGFAASSALNWDLPGITGALLAAGRRVITYDSRGHGLSDKPHDLAAYGDDALPRDVSTVLDHLEVESVDLIGYSMGALVGGRVLCLENRVRSAVLGGVGHHLVEAPVAKASSIADGMDAAAVGDTSTDTGRLFRAFAEQTGADLRALSALVRAYHPMVDARVLASVGIPLLLVCGADDRVNGDVQRLATVLPDARVVVVPGDHLGAVLQPELREAIVSFLAEVDAAAVP